jgi:hypothetical protein
LALPFFAKVQHQLIIIVSEKKKKNEKKEIKEMSRKCKSNERSAANV